MPKVRQRHVRTGRTKARHAFQALSLPGRSSFLSSAASAPPQFASGDWSVANPATSGDITITITTLPVSGGPPITDIERQIDAGAWTSLSAAVPGAYTVSGLTDDVEVQVGVRGVNVIGNGQGSVTKPVTPTA